MGDRRSSFPFRLWTSGATRRKATTRTPPPSTTSRSTEPSLIAITSPTTPTLETNNGKPGPSNTTATTELTPQNSSELHTTIQPNNTETSASMVADPHTSEPSHSASQFRQSLQPESQSLKTNESGSPIQPSSPSRSSPTSSINKTTKTRSPPQLSYPSRVSPQTRSSPSSTYSKGSQTPSTPQKASQPHSPSHLTSRSIKHASSPSTKGIQPASGSKESKTPTQEISIPNETTFIVNEEEPKLSASQQETTEQQRNTEAKFDNVDNSNDLLGNGSNKQEKEMKAMPSKLPDSPTATIHVHSPEAPAPIQKIDFSDVNGEHKPASNLNPKPEETREVKEVEQVANTESIEGTKEYITSPNPESDFETQRAKNDNTRNNSEQMHEEKQETFGKKETSAASSPPIKQTNTTSQPKKQGLAYENHKQSALPSRQRAPLCKDIREDISTFVNKMNIGDPESSIYDKPFSVITLAGENRGASMHLGLDSPKKEGSIHIHRGYKINPDETINSTTDGEGQSKETEAENMKTLEDQQAETYVNNNAQSINNSIVFNSSITERNPGVHVAVISHVPKDHAEPIDKTRPLETRKAEFSMTNADKFTYKPTIRRRCLKGLFLEPSDSETDNTEKPRRHGCRVGRKESGKDGEIDVLSA